MKRFILALACVAAALARVGADPASAKAAADQQVALSAQPATNEPHHKRLLYTNDVRVFDVIVAPGQNASALHDHDMATLVLGNGTLGITRNGQPIATSGPLEIGSVSITEQTGAPSTFRIESAGTTDFHAIEVENMRDDGKWLMPQIIMAPGTSLLTQSRAFSVYDVKLAADQTTRHEHAWSTIAVLLSGAIEQGGIGGEEPARLRGGGQWLTLPRAQAHTLTAIGGDAHVVEIEAR
jgi:hypothetical protein